MDTKSVPRYRVIAERLSRDILKGVIEPGTRLPPERKMAEEYGVAVGTLRHALSQLTEIGLIRRRQGSGNYVTGKLPETDSHQYSFLELNDGGGRASWDILALEPVSGPAPFGSIEIEAFWRFRRMQRLDGVPVAAEEIWMDAERFAELDADAGPDAFYRYYQTYCSLWIDIVEDRVVQGDGPDWLPPSMAHLRGQPCLVVDRIARDNNGNLVEASRFWIDTQRAHYVNRFR